ncbi:hypothetical protein TNIN_163881 [Trichonephila inaurata madagascariensis]|uniref:Uncharacterized protein n=1 Tax=Trichonephila inaurata madagascariensis TaxID=2747483 RepID=A0A8X7BV76_9ARAC|nr:hypothetical protein TNIN_163881 [Trichonephila inaurata madagascariensis]
MLLASKYYWMRPEQRLLVIKYIIYLSLSSQSATSADKLQPIVVGGSPEIMMSFYHVVWRFTVDFGLNSLAFSIKYKYGSSQNYAILPRSIPFLLKVLVLLGKW